MMRRRSEHVQTWEKGNTNVEDLPVLSVISIPARPSSLLSVPSVGGPPTGLEEVQIVS